MASFRNKLLLGCAIVGVCFFASAPEPPAEPGPDEASSATNSLFETQIDPAAESNFSLALFRIWFPERKLPVKGILAVLPVSDADGTPLANDSQWQAIARKWNFALLAITFTSGSSTPPYYRAEFGTGQALLSALSEFADASGHAELKDAPIAILGHSQGGQFALHFACWKPERVLAFATIKGGFYNINPSEAARAVPGLLITAERDAAFRQKNIRSLFEANSTTKSRWAFASEPNAAHELGRSLRLIIPFFDAVIGDHLQPYSGDLRTLAVQPLDAKLELGHPWLPNQDVADLWSHFAGGTLSEAASDLQIPSNPPHAFAQVSPGTHDFGNIETTAEAPTAVFHVSRGPTDPPWNSIRAFSVLARCEVSAGRLGEDWIVSVSPRSARLPLGRMRDTIFVRYLQDGSPVFGGSELTVSLNHTSLDLKLSASHYYLGAYSQPCQKSIEFTVPEGKPLEIRSAELLIGSGATVSVVQHTSSTAAVVADFQALPESGEQSGIIAVHLAEPLPTTVLIPFIGFYRSPAESIPDP